MMKKLFLLILPLLAITFISCSKDDDGGDGNGNGTKKVSRLSSKVLMEQQFTNSLMTYRMIGKDRRRRFHYDIYLFWQ